MKTNTTNCIGCKTGSQLTLESCLLRLRKAVRLQKSAIFAMPSLELTFPSAVKRDESSDGSVTIWTKKTVCELFWREAKRIHSLLFGD